MKLRVLSVEDTTDSALLIQAALEDDYDLVVVKSLVEARRELTEKLPALLILDASLPDGDGMSFCRWLKADPNYKKIPVLFLTGRTAEEEKRFALKIGANGYLTKPIDPDKLKEKVVELLAANQRVA